jgi:putative peptidoglycan lipid II flippase
VNARRLTTGIAGAATLIAAITVLSRAVGFGRWWVFSESVGSTCLGSAYTTANMLPNVVFELVAGGALAGAVVPLIAVPLASGDKESVRHTASALLSWALVVLVPLSLLGMLVAGPLMNLLVPDQVRDCNAADVAAVAGQMFVVFAPQIALYGVAVVCSGILNAHRRFLAAAVAPLLSSCVVIVTYVAFGVGFDGSRMDLAELPQRWERLLAVGTTLGVVALALTTLIPVVLLRLGLRPTLHFPAGEAVRARNLALAGVAAVAAQQASVLVVIVLANRVGGGLAIYNYAWAVYLLPYAVLAIPIATAAFTALSEHRGRDDEDSFRRTAAGTTRAVVITALLGAGLLAGTAAPVAGTFIGPHDAGSPQELSRTLVAFAPGLVGFALIAHLGRVLYARHAGRAAASAIVTGWLVVLVGSVVLATAVSDEWIVAALGAANSVGMLVAGWLLLMATSRVAGGGALAGLPRALGAGAAGAVAAAAVAAGLATVPDVEGRVAHGLVAVLAGAAGVVVFGALVLMLDGGDLRAVVRRRFARV